MAKAASKLACSLKLSRSRAAAAGALFRSPNLLTTLLSHRQRKGQAEAEGVEAFDEIQIGNPLPFDLDLRLAPGATPLVFRLERGQLRLALGQPLQGRPLQLGYRRRARGRRRLLDQKLQITRSRALDTARSQQLELVLQGLP